MQDLYNFTLRHHNDVIQGGEPLAWRVRLGAYFKPNLRKNTLMKTDIDRLMTERDLAAIIVAIDHNYSPPLDYLCGSVHITGGLCIKPQGKPPVLIVNSMETEEAAATGLQVYSFNDMNWLQFVEDADGDRTAAEVEFWGYCLKELGVPEGKIGIYGVSDLNLIIEIVRLLDARYPEYTFKGETGATIFTQAAITKDDRRNRPHHIRRGAHQRRSRCRLAFHRLTSRARRRWWSTPMANR
jgi:hypothetical protein